MEAAYYRLTLSVEFRPVWEPLPFEKWLFAAIKMTEFLVTNMYKIHKFYFLLFLHQGTRGNLGDESVNFVVICEFPFTKIAIFKGYLWGFLH